VLALMARRLSQTDYGKLMFMVRPLTLILFPVCARLASRGEWHDLRRLMRKMFAGMTGIGLAAWAFGAPLALLIVRRVYGPAYGDSAPVLRILCLSAPGLYVAIVGMFVASSMHRERMAVAIMAIGIAVNMTLNFVAIPRYGALGAAWVTVSTQSFVGLWPIVHLCLTRQPTVQVREGIHLQELGS
jgi:PST family polysaccharide transporter